jgi:hypothetical protein
MSDNIPTNEVIDKILYLCHGQHCRTRTMPFKGQKEPFPCDCYILEAHAALSELVREARLEEVLNIPNSPDISQSGIAAYKQQRVYRLQNPKKEK